MSHLPRRKLILHQHQRAPRAVVLVSDTFSDTDETLLSEHAIAPLNNIAAAWSEVSSTNVAAIRSSTARMGSYIANSYTQSVISTATPNVHITAKLYHYNHSAIQNSLIGRVSDESHYWQVKLVTTQIKLIERNGSITERAAAAASLSDAFYDTELTLDGNSIRGKVNGISVSYESALFNAVTQHGFELTIGSNSWALALAQVDSFLMETVP